MKNTNALLVITSILFSSSSIIRGDEYKCENLQYEGSNPYDKSEIEKNAIAMKTKLYNEVLPLFNEDNGNSFPSIKEHYFSSLPQDGRLKLCRCIYTAMTKKPESASAEDETLIMGATFQFLKDAGNGLERTPLKTPPTVVLDCYVENLSFTLIHGYTPTLCFNCHDIYVQVYDALNRDEAPKFAGKGGENVGGNTSVKLIGVVYKVNYSKLYAEEPETDAKEDPNAVKVSTPDK